MQEPQGERGTQGRQGPEGPRGSISLIAAFVLIGIGMGIIAGWFTAHGGASDNAPKPAARLLTLTLPPPGACGLVQAAFCDTFDAPSPVINRSGQLSPAWGVSRFSGDENLSGNLDRWATTQLVACGGAVAVHPPNDVIICGGQLREAVNDNGTVTVLAMYPKQPFDWTGRTGKIVFDVSNDTEGSHAAWPELWITDKPVPAPFAHGSTWRATGQHSVGLRFSAAGGPCPGGWSVESVVITRGYVTDDEAEGGTTHTARNGCASFGSFGAMNHVEVRVAQNQIEVWATDAGAPVSSLHLLATVSNANLSFTSGLVWIEDAHYNAVKGGTGVQAQHTFAWDNFGFDGPVTYQDASYDVLDALVNLNDGTYNLGWKTFLPADVMSVNTLPMDATLIASAQAVRLLFNFEPYTVPSSFTYTINGHPHTVPWPFLDTQGFTIRTVAFDVPKSDLISGANNIKIVADQPMIVAQVGIVLVNVNGAAPTPTPGAVPSATPTSAPLPTPTGTPSAVICHEVYERTGTILISATPRACG